MNAATCRYGLETAEPPAAQAEQEDSEAAEAQASQNGGGSGRRHLSAKERKLLKKVRGLEAARWRPDWFV